MNETIYSVLTSTAFIEEDATFSIKHKGVEEKEGPLYLTETMIEYVSKNTDEIESIQLQAGNIKMDISYQEVSEHTRHPEPQA